jgi:hypothetical protein
MRLHSSTGGNESEAAVSTRPSSGRNLTSVIVSPLSVFCLHFLSISQRLQVFVVVVVIFRLQKQREVSFGC